jgi:hypothetical protein
MMAACGATVRVGSKSGVAPSVPLAAVLKTALDPTSILMSLHVPFNDGDKIVFDSHKAMGRHANAHAYANGTNATHKTQTQTQLVCNIDSATHKTHQWFLTMIGLGA